MKTAEETNTSATVFEARFSQKWTMGLVLTWAGIVSVVAWPSFLTNLGHYSKLGTPVYYGMIAALAVLAAAVVLHRSIYRRTAQFEPTVFAVVTLGICLSKEPVGTVTISLLAASAFAIGRFAQRRLGLKTDSPVADVGLCGTLGLSLLILAMMTLGTIGLIRTEVGAGLLIGSSLLLRRSLVDLWLRAKQSLRRWPEAATEGDWVPSIAVVSLIVFGGFTLAVALTPTISIDALRYHLPSAVYYVDTGSLAPVPGLRGSHLPQAVELLMSLAYSLGGLPAARFVNPLFFALCIPLIYALMRSCGFGRGAAILAVVAGTCVPFVHWAGSVVKVDLAVPLFQLMSLDCFLRGRRSKNVNWLLVGLLFLALSVGTKLTAIYGALPLCLLHTYLFFHLVAARVRFRPAQVAALVALVVVIAPFWQYRAYRAVGDPWYPFNLGLLVKNIPPLTGLRPGPIEADLHYPWITHFEGRMSFEGVSDNPAGMFLVLFGLAWLLVRRRKTNSSERVYLIFAALSYLYWGFMWGFLRYGIPMFVVMYALTAGRVVEMSRERSRVLRAAIAAGLIACLLYSVTVTALYEINMPQLL